MNAQLSPSLKQAVPTRWDSNFIMLDSYVKVKTCAVTKKLNLNFHKCGYFLQSYSDLKALLEKREEAHRLENFEFRVVEEIVNFLKPFHECSVEFQADKVPTVYKVAPWVHKLELHLQENVRDSALIKAIKREAKKYFAKYLTLDDFYYMACLLNPM